MNDTMVDIGCHFFEATKKIQQNRKYSKISISTVYVRYYFQSET